MATVRRLPVRRTTRRSLVPSLYVAAVLAFVYIVAEGTRYWLFGGAYGVAWFAGVALCAALVGVALAHLGREVRRG